jgi:glucuronate isomerase
MRAMRANGVGENYTTGAATPYEKFLAWARTVPYTLRNPLYHWTHLALQRYFGISELLDEKSAPSVWERANAVLEELTAHAILEKFKVKVVCTTDDPTDDLRYHRHSTKSNLATRVFPAFRPDQALAIGTAEFVPWVDRLAQVANLEVRDLNAFLQALESRHEEFHSLGCRLSDHGLKHGYATPCAEPTAAALFAKARAGQPIGDDEHAQFASFMMLFFGRLDAAKGWSQQLHLGVLRNVNTAARRRLGADTGYDAVGDFPQTGAVAQYLDISICSPRKTPCRRRSSTT